MLLAVLGAALAATALAPRTLDDAAITAVAAARFDKTAMMGKHIVLGLHNGVRVIADYPCSDICPHYTVRIIHYDLAPADCARAKGRVRTEMVPMGPAVVGKQFCVPAVLASRRP